MIELYKNLWQYAKEKYPTEPKILVILRFTGWAFLATFFLIALVSISKASKQASAQANRYPSTKYRKVIKEGLFWDNVEYHER